MTEAAQTAAVPGHSLLRPGTGLTGLVNAVAELSAGYSAEAARIAGEEARIAALIPAGEAEGTSSHPSAVGCWQRLLGEEGGNSWIALQHWEEKDRRIWSGWREETVEEVDNFSAGLTDVIIRDGALSVLVL